MRRLKFAFLVALFLAFPALASADTMIEVVSTNFSGMDWTGGFQPFNHNLGTLTSVAITINGGMSATVQTMQNIQFPGIPVPTPFSLFLNQSFSGIPNGAFFTFSSPALFEFHGTGSGGGEAQQVFAPFNYTFHFDSTTDLTGFAAVSGSPGVGLAAGTLSGFTDTFSPAMFELMTISPLAVTGGTFLSASADGAIIVEYDYTPATSSVPEPGTLLLLGWGLVSLFSARARKL
jgi:PEP-CTERM motif